MKKNKYLVYLSFILIIVGCDGVDKNSADMKHVYVDAPFVQETHVGFKIGTDSESNDVRCIAIDSLQNIWIATKGGVYTKQRNGNIWQAIQNKENSGPSFSISVDQLGNVWFGTWNGFYKYSKGKTQKIKSVKPPISAIAFTKSGVYAFGTYGAWLINGDLVNKLDITISKGIRDAINDKTNGLWLASDVGLYHYTNGKVKLYQNENELISCYLKGVSYSDDKSLWAGGLGGITIRDENKKINTLTTNEGISNAEVNCVERSKQGVMWVGTNMGIVRYSKDGSHTLRFSKRWLMDDKVRDIKFDNDGTAWIATASGVSAIKRIDMTLSKKADYFYKKLMKKHVREPWIIHRVALEVEGDTSSWRHWDDDNDGEYTGIYLSMESLRYATTGDKDAKEKARKAFHFLKYLQEVTETDGFFARTIVPVGWGNLNDKNRKYSDREVAEELVKNPRFKKVENRWRKSKNGKWLWKGDTSSDEMCGHFMGYYYYYEFAADEKEKGIIKTHVKKIIDYLIKNNYNFVDIDGKPTLWANWSPDKLNRVPDWGSERSLNSFELLAFLKFTYHVTGDEKYQSEYLRLIEEEGYLENTKNLNNKNPAWEIYFDIPMAGYLFPILIKYEQDPKLKKYYEELMDEWFEKQRTGKNPLNNFTYNYVRDNREEIENSISFLIDTPLDLVDWRIDHSTREDISIVRQPILEDKQTSVLPPASIRATVRWDKNPWAAIQGNPYSEREPVFWLLPYWMAKHLEIIRSIE